MNFFSGRVFDPIYKYTLYDLELSGIIQGLLLTLFNNSYSKQASENFLHVQKHWLCNSTMWANWITDPIFTWKREILINQ